MELQQIGKYIAAKRKAEGLTQEALAQLPPDEFFQCHRSYIVAFRHIEQICGNEILLSNGQHIPIGRTFMKPLKEALLKRQFSQ